MVTILKKGKMDSYWPVKLYWLLKNSKIKKSMVTDGCHFEKV